MEIRYVNPPYRPGDILYVRETWYKTYKEFSKLWNSTIKKDQLSQYGWKVNPWVWVIEFSKQEVIR